MHFRLVLTNNNNLEKVKVKLFHLPTSMRLCFDLEAMQLIGYLSNSEAVLGAMNALCPDAIFLVDMLEFMDVIAADRFTRQLRQRSSQTGKQSLLAL